MGELNGALRLPARVLAQSLAPGRKSVGAVAAAAFTVVMVGTFGPKSASAAPQQPPLAQPLVPAALAQAPAPAPTSLAPAAPSPQQTTAADAQVQALVSRVDAAAAEVRSQGEAAFTAFRRPGAPWFEGEAYIVVLGSDGRSVVYPPDPRGEGLNYSAFEDLGGKPFGRQILAVADSPSGRGWVHYQWRRPNPNDRRPVWKATFVERVTAPSGRTYLVLSGLYEPPMVKAFVVDAVDSATALLRRQGRAAFEALRDRRGPFFYQDTYVFVLDRNGTLLLNPAFPALEGRSVLSWPDPAERATAAASLQAVLRDGSTWTTYNWPRPSASTLPERKTTYLRKVVAPGGEVLIVGSGLYAGE